MPLTWGGPYYVVESLGYVWDVDTLSWVPATGGGSGPGTEVEVTNFPASQAVTGTFFQATQPVSAAALPLPSGAATAAKQDTEITSLASIDGKLTNPLPVSGTVTANISGSISNTTFTAIQATGTNLHTVVDSGTITTVGAVTSITNPVAVTSAGLSNLDVALSTRTKPADQQHAIIDSGSVGVTNAFGLEATQQDVLTALTVGPVPISGSISANSSADVIAIDGDAGYTDGETAQNLTQTSDGRLRVGVAGLVSEVPESYITGEVRSLSLTTEGRLRVATFPAATELDMFVDFSSTGNFTENRVWPPLSPWSLGA